MHTALRTLGLDARPDAPTLRRAERRALLVAHPDHGGSREALEAVRAAARLLADHLVAPAAPSPVSVASAPATATVRPTDARPSVSDPVPSARRATAVRWSTPETVPQGPPPAAPVPAAYRSRSVHTRVVDEPRPVRSPARPGDGGRTPSEFARILDAELARTRRAS